MAGSARVEKDYSHRDVVDKLGVKVGQAISFATEMGALDDTLSRRILDRVGRAPATGEEAVDVVLVWVDDRIDAVDVLRRWRSRLKPTGGIWLLTPKRGRPGYVDQRELMAAGLTAGLVDNKVCSVSDETSAIRFVIRRADRAGA